MGKITLEQIGKELDISKVAVHKALNDKPGVSDELRKRVKETAARLGYTPCNSRYKTNLNFIYAIKKSFFLFAGEQFYTTIYYYLNSECERIDSSLSLLFYEDDGPVEELNKKLSASKTPIAGVFIAGETNHATMEKIKDLPVPFVFIDYYSPLFPYNYVYVDNYNLSYIATKYLIDKGHRRIGFVGDITSTSAIKDRFFGYEKALLEHNLPIERAFHINCNIEKSEEYDFDFGQTLPSAFVCHCDSAAHRLYLILKFRGFRIPDDISIISFDNTELCKTMSPALTSVGVAKEKYARKSMELMLDKLNGARNAAVLLKPTLTERESVACPIASV